MLQPLEEESGLLIYCAYAAPSKTDKKAAKEAAKQKAAAKGGGDSGSVEERPIDISWADIRVGNSPESQGNSILGLPRRSQFTEIA